MASETELKVAAPLCCEGPDRGEELRDGRRLSDMAVVLKALSDPTRLHLFRNIVSANDPICECEVVPGLGVSQPTVSYHLKVLRQAGLIEVERRGVWAYYRPRAGALLKVIGDLAEIAS